MKIALIRQRDFVDYYFEKDMDAQFLVDELKKHFYTSTSFHMFLNYMVKRRPVPLEFIRNIGDIDAGEIVDGKVDLKWYVIHYDGKQDITEQARGADLWTD